MFKKLIFLLVMVSLFVIPANADTSKVFIYATAFTAIPTDDGAGTYDPYFGFQFEGHYAIGKQITMGITYKDWQLRGEGSRPDLDAEYKGGSLTYWVNPNGSNFNLGFMGGVGQSKIIDGGGTNQNLAEVYGFITKYYIYKNMWLTGTVKIGRFGDLTHDALMVSLGIGAPISF